MQIKSPLFGSAEIAEDKIIDFPAGLPGFEHCRRFALLHEEGGEAHVFLLQSVDEPDVAFSVTAPERLGAHLEFSLTDAEVASLRLRAPEDAAVAVIVRKDGDEDPRPATTGLRANFMAPLVINTGERIGLQKVIGQLDCEITLRAKD